MDNPEKILSWYVLSGVDEICGEEPMNLLSAKNDKQVSHEIPNSGRPATTLLAQENTAACNNAREICDKAQTLEDLKAMVETFEG